MSHVDIQRRVEPSNANQHTQVCLDLSGPRLTQAFEDLVKGSESLGGIERYVNALRVKISLFQRAAAENRLLEREVLTSICAFMASVRRRIGVYLDADRFPLLHDALAQFLSGIEDTSQTDERIAAFCGSFPQDKAHRWVRDLAAELLHNIDPERYPLMCRWVWDRGVNTGVLREIWFGDDVDHRTIDINHSYASFLMLREELSQFLTANGVFSDSLLYVDLLCAQIYADYICAQGGSYLRADFSSPDDPMQHARRLLGLDGVRSGSNRTRLKTIDGEAFVIQDELRSLA